MSLPGGFAKGQLRDVVGPGSVINAEGHEGVSKAHKIEDIVIAGEEKGYKRNKPAGKVPMNNPGFEMSPSEKKA
jgi:hypothetical protein